MFVLPGLARSAPECVPLAMPPLFTCLWSTDPRARVCRPCARSPASEIRRTRVLGPDAPVRALVVCPARFEPGSRQPEQYALDPGRFQIPGQSPGGRPSLPKAWHPRMPTGSATSRSGRFPALAKPACHEAFQAPPPAVPPPVPVPETPTTITTQVPSDPTIGDECDDWMKFTNTRPRPTLDLDTPADRLAALLAQAAEQIPDVALTD
jgi:hypothetical protein